MPRREIYEIADRYPAVMTGTVGCRRTGTDVMITIADEEKLFDIFLTKKQFMSAMFQGRFLLRREKWSKDKAKKMRILKKI